MIARLQEDFQRRKSVELMLALLVALNRSITAIGVNLDVLIKARKGATAASLIANYFNGKHLDIAPAEFDLTAGAVRLTLRSQTQIDVTFLLSVEPVNNDATTGDISMTCNANLEGTELPQAEKLYAMLSECRRIESHARATLLA